MPRRLSRAWVVRVFRPRSSVSSTRQSVQPHLDQTQHVQAIALRRPCKVGSTPSSTIRVGSKNGTRLDWKHAYSAATGTYAPEPPREDPRNKAPEFPHIQIQDRGGEQRQNLRYDKSARQ